MSDTSLHRPDCTEELTRALRERILVVDGAMGTAIQRDRPDEAGYRGERFADWASDVQGNNDLLTLTQPDIIAGIHREYLEAGADIIETNTFNANSISLSDYGMQDLAYEFNYESAKLALDVYVHRLKKYVGAYHAILGRLDVLTFTAGVGENDDVVRARVCEGLEPLGIRIDLARNEGRGGPKVISTDDSPVTVLVFPTNEELAIARQAVEVIEAAKA